jgi:hypothetical protein
MMEEEETAHMNLEDITGKLLVIKSVSVITVKKNQKLRDLKE